MSALFDDDLIFTLDDGTDEELRVLLWREEQLLKAGFPADLARYVSECEADLHVAIGLLEHGCPLDLAERILL